MAELKIHEQVKELLDRYGLSISTTINNHWDRRDYFPDDIHYVVLKDGEKVFSYDCRCEEGENIRESNGEYEASALKKCLDYSAEQRYREQSALFKRAISQLMDLKKNHKFSKFAEKKELKEMCEQLSSFKYDGNYPKGQPEYSINVPLMEDNRELFEQLVRELEELSKTVGAERDAEAPQPNS